MLRVICIYPLQGLDKLRKQVEEPAGPLSEGEKKAWVAEKGKEVDREAFKIFCFKAKAVSFPSIENGRMVPIAS